jgi:hypothetical protein
MLEGTDEEVADAKDALKSQLGSICQQTHTFERDIEVRLFTSVKAKEAVKAASQTADPAGVVTFEANTLTTLSFDQKADQMITAGRQVIQRREILLQSEHQQAVRLESFCQLLKSLETASEGLLVTEISSEKIEVCGLLSSFHDDVNKIEDFIKINTIQEATFDVDPRDFRLLQVHLKRQKGEEMAAETYNESTRQLSISMMPDALNQMKDLLKNFKEQLIITETRTFTEPSFSKYIHSEQGQKRLKTVEHEFSCDVLKIETDKQAQVAPSPAVNQPTAGARPANLAREFTATASTDQDSGV